MLNKFFNSKRFGLLLTILFLVGYELISFNRYFPLQEGWFQAYARDILRGKMMYRDFYMFIQPLFPLHMALLTWLFKGGFLAFRVYGIFERIVLFSIIYRLLAKYFRPSHAFIATVTSMMVYAGSKQDIIYSYYQTCLLFSLLMLYCSLILLEKSGDKTYDLWAILTGLTGSISFLYKQTTGVVVPCMIFLFVLLAIWRIARSKFFRTVLFLGISYIVPIFVCWGWLIANHAFGFYFYQVFSGASSKGSIPGILYGFISIMAPALQDSFIAVSLILLIVFLYFKKWVNRRILIIVLSFVGLYLLFPYILADFLLVPVLVTIGLFAYFVEQRMIKSHLQLDQENAWITFMFAGILLSLIFSYYYPAVSYRLYTQMNFFDSRRILVYWTFLFSVFYTLYLFGQVFLKGYSRADWIPLLMISSVGFMVMYAHGISHVIEEHSVLPSLGLMIALSLRAGTFKTYKKVINILIVTFCIVVIYFSATQRFNNPYWWWGWEEPSIYQATEKSSLHELDGFRLSPTTNYVINSITRIIKANTGPNDKVFTFPHVVLFNVLTKRDNGLFAHVHYFDVCPDEIAIQDGGRLKKSPPKVIVWMNLSEDQWKLHERFFRNGKYSGQRKIQQVVNEMVSSGIYKKEWTFKNITVWVRKK